jgi:deazaflavin-dependent oxidoreductase (nitroreductase family)
MQEDSSMTAQTKPVDRAPIHVRLINPLLKAMMAAGIPLGPNGLITIRGRKSGLPRTTGIAIINDSGRRWVWAPWGDVNWVRNLRAARRATINYRGRKGEFSATELDRTERLGFFRDVYIPMVRTIPGGFTLARIVDGVDLNHPEEIAQDRRVFELHPLTTEQIQVA